MLFFASSSSQMPRIHHSPSHSVVKAQATSADVGTGAVYGPTATPGSPVVLESSINQLLYWRSCLGAVAVVALCDLCMANNKALAGHDSNLSWIWSESTAFCSFGETIILLVSEILSCVSHFGFSTVTRITTRQKR